jgi:hypothetical protein
VCGWLSGVAHASEGSRNDWLFWAACRFGEFLAEGRLRREVAEQLLFAAANGLVRTDGQQSVLATIASGLRTGSARTSHPPILLMVMPHDHRRGERMYWFRDTYLRVVGR